MKFGIELEFTASVVHAQSSKYGNFYEHILQLMRESAICGWHFETDASCGNEIVSPILEGELGLSQALQACLCAKEAQQTYKLGTLIGKDAGVHYHFDANDLIKNKTKTSIMPIRNILILSAILEPLWFSMNPASRFETAFAAPLNFNLFQMIRARDMVDIRDIWFRHYMGVMGHSDSYRIHHNSYSPAFVNSNYKPDKYDWTRYHGMNLVALWKHGTFEFRYTHGSFEPENIEAWYRHYKSVVDVARSINTRTIVRACPYNLEDIKCSSINGLQDVIYNNLNLAIRFMFMAKSKMGKPLFAPDAKMLKFILMKIIKYNPKVINMNIVKKIWKDDGTNFQRLMGYITGLKITSTHSRRNRYQWTPKANPMSQNGTPAPTADFMGLDEAAEDGIIDANY